MLSNMRNQPGEGQGNSSRTHDENNRENRYEGFEGMNYEQIRQPYHPKQKNMDTNDSGPKRNRQEEEQA